LQLMYGFSSKFFKKETKINPLIEELKK
jgi:hypothetical protein